MFRIDADRLTREFSVPPGPIYRELIEGRSIKSPDGRIILPEMVSGIPRKSRKIVILGDTCDPSAIVDHAMDADVLVHEATCSDDDLQVALSKGHSTAGMAGDFARRIRAKHLVLNHFSPRGFRPNEYEESKNIRLILQQARDKFQSDNVYAARVIQRELKTILILMIYSFIILFFNFRIIGDFQFHYQINKRKRNFIISSHVHSFTVTHAHTQANKVCFQAELM